MRTEVRTTFGIEGVFPLTQRAAAGRTAETLPVEVETLGANSLHHVNPPLARVTLVAGRGERSAD